MDNQSYSRGRALCGTPKQVTWPGKFFVKNPAIGGRSKEHAMMQDDAPAPGPEGDMEHGPSSCGPHGPH